ncbi:hypothetical protein ABH894_005328 [Paenibacillus sp. RC62]
MNELMDFMKRLLNMEPTDMSKDDILIHYLNINSHLSKRS